jgi:hypothetical protein
VRFLYEDFGPAFLRGVLAAQPPEVARERFRRARMFSIWDTLVWARDRIRAGEEAEVPAALLQLEESRGTV